MSKSNRKPKAQIEKRAEGPVKLRMATMPRKGKGLRLYLGTKSWPIICHQDNRAIVAIKIVTDGNLWWALTESGSLLTSRRNLYLNTEAVGNRNKNGERDFTGAVTESTLSLRDLGLISKLGLVSEEEIRLCWDYWAKEIKRGKAIEETRYHIKQLAQLGVQLTKAQVKRAEQQAAKRIVLPDFDLDETIGD